MKIREATFYLMAMAGLALLGRGTLQAQSNILSDGSFESFRLAVPPGWQFTGGYSAVVNEHGAADGKCWPTSGTFAQDLATVTGRTYRIRFALSGATVNVKWNNALVGTVSSGGGGWNYTNLYVTATGAVSRIGFELGGSMDDVSVGWMEEPPSITRAVPSRSTFEGGTVTMPVVISGAPVLRYQWTFEGDPLAGATNEILVLTNVQKSMEGNYAVTVSNAFGVVESLPATLMVHSIPKVPTIVHQPKSVQMTAGYSAGFYVFAVGEQPLFYQWRFNGTNIAGGTNLHFTISPVSTNSAGAYSVLVSNHFGTVMSYPATLAVQVGAGGGWVDWSNYEPYLNGVDSRVFDVDGVTPLEGPDYVAQLYAGATSNSLHAVSEMAPFSTGFEAGLYYGNFARVPDVLAYETAYIQVRVWDKSRWETFEEAAALGGKVGKSEIIPKKLYSEIQVPTFTELYSFKLESGSPVLATARLYPNLNSPESNREWLLIGEVGAQYIVESRTPPNDWNPIMLVTNTTGTVTFTDPNAQNSSVKFYRAQIINP